jgi:hypothetical protein
MSCKNHTHWYMIKHNNNNNPTFINFVYKKEDFIRYLVLAISTTLVWSSGDVWRLLTYFEVFRRGPERNWDYWFDNLKRGFDGDRLKSRIDRATIAAITRHTSHTKNLHHRISGNNPRYHRTYTINNNITNIPTNPICYEDSISEADNYGIALGFT